MNHEIFEREIIAVALERKASDILIELRISRAEIRMRIDGDWTAVATWDAAKAREVIQTMHARSGEGVDQAVAGEVLPSEITMDLDGAKIHLRIQSRALKSDEMDVLIRVLPLLAPSEKDMAAIGYSAEHAERLQQMPSGRGQRFGGYVGVIHKGQGIPQDDSDTALYSASEPLKDN